MMRILGKATLSGLIGLGLLVASVGAQADEPQYQQIFRDVDQSHLQALLKDMTGVQPVSIQGQKYAITDRYAPEMKKIYRAYWKEYFQALGMNVTELAYPTEHNNGESEGHNMEAVLPGQSADSVVIIVHYDSIGPSGNESGNPGVDDDMSGMSILMETARLLAKNPSHLQHTIRFVAADYEEWASPGLEGARQYATYIKSLAQQQGFKIIAAIDDEQSGWNCTANHACPEEEANNFDIFSCSSDGQYNNPALGDALAGVATQFSTLTAHRDCIGENSDLYAMWETGVPSVVFSEHNPFSNPHFDQNGGDIYDRIDQDYFLKIAQVAVTFAAETVGVTP